MEKKEKEKRYQWLQWCQLSGIEWSGVAWGATGCPWQGLWKDWGIQPAISSSIAYWVTPKSALAVATICPESTPRHCLSGLGLGLGEPKKGKGETHRYFFPPTEMRSITNGVKNGSWRDHLPVHLLLPPSSSFSSSFLLSSFLLSSSCGVLWKGVSEISWTVEEGSFRQHLMGVWRC